MIWKTCNVMAKAKKINYMGLTIDIAPDADKVGYSNSTMSDVTNAKGALDNLHQRMRTVEQIGSSALVSPRYKNNPLPAWKDNVKVLIIGNSLCAFPCFEMDNILNGFKNNGSIDLSTTDVYIRDCHQAGQPLKSWLSWMKSNTKITKYFGWRVSNGAWERYVNENTGLRTAVSDTEWDVIALQVYPNNYGTPEDSESYITFSNTLKDFVREIRTVCPNKKVAIAFIMVYPQSVGQSMTRETWESKWSSIVTATKQTVADAGIDIVVPLGTVYANASNTNTFNGENTHFLMRDPSHPGFGVGQWMGAATIWESLVAPVLGRSIMEIDTVAKANTYNQYYAADIPIVATGDNENLSLCKKIVMSTIADMYNITDDIDPIS